MGIRELAQLVKYLHKDMSSIPSTHVKSRARWHTPVILVSEKQRQEDLWTLLASYSLAKPGSSIFWGNCASKHKGRSGWRRQLTLILGTHTIIKVLNTHGKHRRQATKTKLTIVITFENYCKYLILNIFLYISNKWLKNNLVKKIFGTIAIKICVNLNGEHVDIEIFKALKKRNPTK